jgi:hypothetical protein
MNLQGANPNPQVLAEDRQNYYENYHTTALHTDSATVNSYSKITYKNIYPGIDWVLYIKDNKLEYDFIVNPGGNVNDIKIKYNGATDIAHNVGNINITTPLGNVTEQQLYAYEKDTKRTVPAAFAINKGDISFKVSSYKGVLVIDPTLAWGAYFGGTNRDAAYANACDNTGNIYMCGFTESVNNIATVGAYQTAYHGSEDAFIAKYDNLGTVLWATYYGGASQDIANAATCDGFNNVYITGITYSTTDIATTGSHQDTLAGSNDAFLAKFNENGGLQWATYYGGNIGTQAGGITCDISNNICISGYTASNANIATISSYQDTLSGNGNAYVAKFDGIGGLIWATYFGLSTGGDGAVACVCDKNKNIYITGGVYDTGIYTTPDCYKSSNGAGNHIFIAKFDSACHLQWSTYFGGDSVEYAFGIASDDSSNIYITGLTNSTNGIATPGAYQPVLGGGECDAFLAKFNDTGALQWSTYYGGNGVDVGNGIVCDSHENVWLTGYTNSSSAIATPDGYETLENGGLDAFVSKFNTSGQLVWGSYYGGSSEDVGMGISNDGAGNIYFSGFTASANNIATLNSYPDSVTDSTHAFIIKIDSGTTAVRDVPQTIKSVNLYPAPNNGFFYVTGEFAPFVTTINIKIMSEDGKVIYKNEAKLQQGILRQDINISACAGTYILQICAGRNTKAIKFLIE